jgi:hypothetical protein
MYNKRKKLYVKCKCAEPDIVYALNWIPKRKEFAPMPYPSDEWGLLV